MDSFFLINQLFRIEVLNHPSKDQFENLLILVEACSEPEAWAKAMELGLAREQSFMNANKHLISWKLEGITNISPVEWPPENGELLSEIGDDYSEDHKAFLLQRIANIAQKLKPTAQLQPNK